MNGLAKMSLRIVCAFLALTALPVLHAQAPRNLVRQTVSVNGTDMSYFYFVSSKCNSFNGQWVVFALHDNGQTVEQFAAQSGWMKVAEDNGFAVVFPNPQGNTWTPSTDSNDDYLKAVFEHARTHMVSRDPGDNVNLGPGPTNPNASGANNVIWAWEPLRDLTGVGAGAVVAQEFAMNHPGLFAAVATMNGAAYEASYHHAGEPSQDVFQHMRGKNVEPVWKQTKAQVPETVWMFHSGPAGAEQTRQAAYWKKSASVAAVAKQRSIEGVPASVFMNATNPAQQFRWSELPASAVYDEALCRAMWDDLFAHTARWTSSPNGDLTPVMTEAEVNKYFEVRSITVPGSPEPYKYYLKLPSSYRKGQKLPLVLSTHGANEQAWLFASKIRMHELGEKEGFITVYPNGRQNHWASNTPDGPDSQFLAAMIQDVVNTYGADPGRVYMQGFSNGSAMTEMMGLTHPELFAAVSPNNGAGTVQGAVKAAVDAVKSKTDIRIPVMAVYGDVDSGASVDGLIVANSGPPQPGMPSSMGAQGGVETLKWFNHINTPDKVETFNSPFAAPYPVDRLQGTHAGAAVDARYPQGRFQVYTYLSSDPRPLNLLQVVWVLDLPHAYDLREAALEWNYFRHWSRNADGTLSYSADGYAAATRKP